MSGQLPAYLRRRVGLQILALLAVLTAMMQLLELLDVTSDIFDRGQGLGGLMYYALLRTPAELGLALPLAVLLGTMIVMNSMARRLEIMAMRASGVSFKRMLGHLLPLLFVIAIFHATLMQAVLPRVEVELKRWWNASAPAEEAPAPLWVHTRGGPVSIETISPDGHHLKGVHLYVHQSGLLTSRLVASTAHWDGRTWQLEDVTELRISDSEVKRIHDDAREWRTNLQPDEVLRLNVARPYLSTMMLAEVIAGARIGSQPRSYYQTALYRSFTAPFGVFIMLLLALPTAATLTRGSGGGGAMLLALVLGLGFLLLDGILASLGASGQMSPLYSALGAPLLFGLIGLVRLQLCERP